MGLNLYFFGQIDDNSYISILKAAFPKADFVCGRGGLYDFEVLRKSVHIVPSVSTYAWLAAWLSTAKTVFLPVAGLFNPRQARTQKFLPFGDIRYRFYQFPLTHAFNIEESPNAFAVEQGKVDSSNFSRFVSHPQLRQIIDGTPTNPQRLDAYLRFFDKKFYLSKYPDIGSAVSSGHLPSGLHHFIHKGFHEQRSCFFMDHLYYANQHPLVVLEIANGEYLDLEHHYVEIGHQRQYRCFN